MGLLFVNATPKLKGTKKKKTLRPQEFYHSCGSFSLKTSCLVQPGEMARAHEHQIQRMTRVWWGNWCQMLTQSQIVGSSLERRRDLLLLAARKGYFLGGVKPTENLDLF